LIQLLQSNDMTKLVESFVRQDQLNHDPFTPTTIVVQSVGIGQWLKHQIAQHSGISANINCILSAELIWRLYKSVLPQHQLPEVSPFNREFLTWRISELLPGLKTAEFEGIQMYLNGSGDKLLRAYQLSHVIAGLYDQYLLYRPDWIQEWEDGQNDKLQPWQSILWRKIISLPGMDKKHHRGNLHNDFIQSLARKKPTSGEFPKLINVFGLSSLPAMHMQALQASAEHLDVDIYFLNPCEHYWGDIVSEKDLAKKSIKKILNKTDALVDEDYFDIGNPLLSSMGKQGREYLEILLETGDIHTHEHFEPRDGGSTLAKIQNDILHLENGKTANHSLESTGVNKRTISDCSSLQIHTSHSRQREIEILIDQIFYLLESNIVLNDIIVMAPNISDYAPYIKAVFQGKLHYSITDQALNEESMIIDIFEQILKLPESRFTALDIISLLETPAISQKLNLDEDERKKINYWIKETGIRWELDGEVKQKNWQLPPQELNTWVFGLKRLILGFATSTTFIHNEGSVHHQDIAPFEISPSDTPLLEKLINFIELLSSIRTKLSQEKKGDEWISLLLSIVEDLFSPESEDEFALNQLREICVGLLDQLQEAQYAAVISPQLIRHWLSDQLSDSSQTKGLISGGITFANLVPMRSIPYEAIFLIGMNDKEYPREDQNLGFDLMQNNYRKGDRSRKIDDRYLFLEALISAKSYFFLSYQGRNIKDNKPLAPSVLVSDLQDYIKRVYGTDLTIEHPLQPFSDKYFDPAYPQLKTYNQGWYKALTSPAKKKLFVDANIETFNANNIADTALIELQDLINFFRHPAKNYLQKQLGIQLGVEQLIHKETESFKLDGLESYQISDSALHAMIKQDSLAHWQKQIRAEGLVMEGMIGNGILNREIEKASAIYGLLVPHLKPKHNYSAELTLDATISNKIFGSVDCYGEEYIDYRTGVLRERQKIEIWIKHLFMAATGHHQSARIISKHPTKNDKASEAIFNPLSKDDAKEYLSELTELYVNNQGKLFEYLPETSAIYFDALSSKNNESQALDKAYKHFDSDRAPAEGMDPYFNRLYQFPLESDQNFTSLAQCILSPMRQYWEKIQ
jgi:exodeoxyribonuclease V gamma subunit